MKRGSFLLAVFGTALMVLGCGDREPLAPDMTLAANIVSENAPWGPATQGILTILRAETATYRFSIGARTGGGAIRDCRFLGQIWVVGAHGGGPIGSVGDLQLDGSLLVDGTALLPLLSRADARSTGVATDCGRNAGTSFPPRMLLKKIEPMVIGQSVKVQGVLYTEH